MGYDVWARFDDPGKYGEGYASAIEEALRASGRERITLEDVQRRFKDYKNSKCAREQVRYNHTHERLVGENERTLAKYFESPSFTAGLDAEMLIEFERFFGDGIKEPEVLANGIDCDGASDLTPEETVRLYRILWTDLIEIDNYYNGNNPEFKRPGRPADREDWGVWRHKFKNPNLGSAGGDTMNSFKTIFNVYESDKGAKTRTLTEQMAMLAYLTHTAGNFIPVPIELGYPINAARGGVGGPGQKFAGKPSEDIKDYMDLTLECIRRWFFGKQFERNPLAEVLSGQGEAGANQCWLKSFGCESDAPEELWRCFVEGNYLEDYVDDQLEVRPFYNCRSKRFSFEKGNAKPDNTKDLESCLFAMNARIIARGIRMRQKAAKKPKVSDDDLKFIFGW